MVIFGYRAPPIPAAPARRFLRYEAGSRAGRQCADLIPQGPRRRGAGAPRLSEVILARESEAVTQRLDDEHYPAYSIGRAAEMVGATPGFLRSLDEAKLLDPQRSGGGHRRYSRHELRLAARVRELLDHGTALDAACRIVVLEDQLDEVRRTIAGHQRDG